MTNCIKYQALAPLHHVLQIKVGMYRRGIDPNPMQCPQRVAWPMQEFQSFQPSSHLYFSIAGPSDELLLLFFFFYFTTHTSTHTTDYSLSKSMFISSPIEDDDRIQSFLWRERWLMLIDNLIQQSCPCTFCIFDISPSISYFFQICSNP